MCGKKTLYTITVKMGSNECLTFIPQPGVYFGFVCGITCMAKLPIFYTCVVEPLPGIRLGLKESYCPLKFASQKFHFLRPTVMHCLCSQPVDVINCQTNQQNIMAPNI